MATTSLTDDKDDIGSLVHERNINANDNIAVGVSNDNNNDDDDEDERRTMRPIDSFDDICTIYRTNLGKTTISLSTIKMEDNQENRIDVKPNTSKAKRTDEVAIISTTTDDIDSNCPSTSSKTCPNDEYTDFLKRMNLRYSHFQFTSEPSGVHHQGQNMDFCDYNKYHSYSRQQIGCEVPTSGSMTDIYGQNQTEDSHYYNGYAQAAAMTQNASCYSYSSVQDQQQQQQQQHQQQQQQQQLLQQQHQHLQHQQQQQHLQQAMPENDLYAYMQSHPMAMSQTNDLQSVHGRESMSQSYKTTSTNREAPTMTSTPTQSYSNDSCCCFPRRAESRNQECGIEQAQGHGQSQTMSGMGMNGMGMGMGMGMGTSGQSMYCYPATGAVPATATATTGMYGMNMTGGGTPMNTVRQQSVGYPSMAMGGFPTDVENFMSKFNQSAQQCFPQGMSMAMPSCFSMNDTINGSNSMSSCYATAASMGHQLQGHSLGQGFINDTLQTQTVYASDYKPFAGMGNNFNHFPNGGSNGLDLLTAESLASSSSSSSSTFGGPGGPELYGGNQIYGMGGDINQMAQMAQMGQMDQLQGYPISQMPQMSSMSYPFPYGGCDVPMASTGVESYMQSNGMCGMNSKAGS